MNGKEELPGPDDQDENSWCCVGATAQRQGWSKVAGAAMTKKFVVFAFVKMQQYKSVLKVTVNANISTLNSSKDNLSGLMCVFTCSL